MKIEFIEQILIDSHCCAVGERVDVDEAKGRRLISWGVAVEVKPEPVREAVDGKASQSRKATARKPQ